MAGTALGLRKQRRRSGGGTLQWWVLVRCSQGSEFGFPLCKMDEEEKNDEIEGESDVDDDSELGLNLDPRFLFQARKSSFD